MSFTTVLSQRRSIARERAQSILPTDSGRPQRESQWTCHHRDQRDIDHEVSCSTGPSKKKKGRAWSGRYSVLVDPELEPWCILEERQEWGSEGAWQPLLLAGQSFADLLQRPGVVAIRFIMVRYANDVKAQQVYGLGHPAMTGSSAFPI